VQKSNDKVTLLWTGRADDNVTYTVHGSADLSSATWEALLPSSTPGMRLERGNHLSGVPHAARAGYEWFKVEIPLGENVTSRFFKVEAEISASALLP